MAAKAPRSRERGRAYPGWDPRAAAAQPPVQARQRRSEYAIRAAPAACGWLPSPARKEALLCRAGRCSTAADKVLAPMPVKGRGWDKGGGKSPHREADA